MNCKIIEYLNKLDSITYNHSIRVALIAREIEEISAKLKDNILSEAALVHDIGKIYISTKILDKVDKLNPLERELVNLHPYIGYEILKSMCVSEKISRVVLYHHSFTPPTLSEIEQHEDADIKDLSLMLRTIDAYEALTSDRPYNRGYTTKEAIEIMRKEERHHSYVMDYLSFVENAGNVSSAVLRNNYRRNPNALHILFPEMMIKKRAI